MTDFDRVKEINRLAKVIAESTEDGTRKLQIEELIKLAKYYKVSLDYITGLTNDPTPNWTIKNNISNSFNNNNGTIGNININQS